MSLNPVDRILVSSECGSRRLITCRQNIYILSTRFLKDFSLRTFLNYRLYPLLTPLFTVTMLTEELDLTCRQLSYTQRQYNDAQNSLQDQINLRVQLEDDLTDARSRILELEDELSRRKKEKKELSKLVLQLRSKFNIL